MLKFEISDCPNFQSNLLWSLQFTKLDVPSYVWIHFWNMSRCQFSNNKLLLPFPRQKVFKYHFNDSKFSVISLPKTAFAAYQKFLVCSGKDIYIILLIRNLINSAVFWLVEESHSLKQSLASRVHVKRSNNIYAGRATKHNPATITSWMKNNQRYNY